ncbi:MAG: hypothetical protein GKS04_03400 [Candidatus Mycalebacterium zealandia]|nr:MAG: hypothetical protein GKS04_03400 [Candidatus Mycalebacterium zealandia]
MELLISMKAEDINTTVFKQGTMMDMPSDQENGYFIMEIRDMNPEKVRILHEYAEKLQEVFEESEEYIIETSETGMKIKNKVDETKPYKKEWDKWADFAKRMHDKLEKYVYWEIIRPKD